MKNHKMVATKKRLNKMNKKPNNQKRKNPMQEKAIK
jgi:hypothetical protein